MTSHIPFNRTVLPAPGDDATPFLLRCYVKPAPFRPPANFGQERRPIHEEFKLYVWRTATLRDIAALIQHASPSISSPQALHAFRLCYYDSKRKAWVSRDAGEGVTRVSPESFQELLPSHKRPIDSDERSAARTLEDLQVVEGDLLDVVVLPDPPAPSLGFARPASLSIRGAARGARGAHDVPSAALGDAHPWGPAGSGQPERDFPRTATGELAGRMNSRRPSRDEPFKRNDRSDGPQQQGWASRAAPRDGSREHRRSGPREDNDSGRWGDKEDRKGRKSSDYRDRSRSPPARGWS